MWSFLGAGPSKYDVGQAVDKGLSHILVHLLPFAVTVNGNLSAFTSKLFLHYIVLE